MSCFKRFPTIDGNDNGVYWGDGKFGELFYGNFFFKKVK
jgi:hypothetical protein